MKLSYFVTHYRLFRCVDYRVTRNWEVTHLMFAKTRNRR